ncbi:hypothetical protein HMI54_000355 [Coelomomyces lativittatus]|nr:hypothetical protein HMI54_000355 [Coelomomyces lativittatus]KAJ1513276.1 hypothetical protein HMI56_002749 [Coelomomyces lativittatus]KAJ1516304.1 hypothetical protein HMI55_002578 [Coelomomyces lativittatus]
MDPSTTPNEDPSSSSLNRSYDLNSNMTHGIKRNHDQKPICRYFAQGFCRDGKQCRFSHGLTSRLISPFQQLHLDRTKPSSSISTSRYSPLREEGKDTTMDGTKDELGKSIRKGDWKRESIQKVDWDTKRIQNTDWERQPFQKVDRNMKRIQNADWKREQIQKPDRYMKPIPKEDWNVNRKEYEYVKTKEKENRDNEVISMSLEPKNIEKNNNDITPYSPNVSAFSPSLLLSPFIDAYPFQQLSDSTWEFRIQLPSDFPYPLTCYILRFTLPTLPFSLSDKEMTYFSLQSNELPLHYRDFITQQLNQHCHALLIKNKNIIGLTDDKCINPFWESLCWLQSQWIYFLSLPEAELVRKPSTIVFRRPAMPPPSSHSLSPRAKAIAELERRFRSSGFEEKKPEPRKEGDEENGTVFWLTMLPTDPDIPMTIALDLAFSIPATYPNAPCQLTIRKTTQLARKICKKIEKELMKVSLKETPLNLVKYLDQHFIKFISNPQGQILPIHQIQGQTETTHSINHPLYPSSKGKKMKFAEASISLENKQTMEDSYPTNSLELANVHSSIENNENLTSALPTTSSTSLHDDGNKEESEDESKEQESDGTEKDTSSSLKNVDDGIKFQFIEPMFQNIAVVQCSYLTLQVKCYHCKRLTVLQGGEKGKGMLETKKSLFQATTVCEQCKSILQYTFRSHLSTLLLPSMGQVKLTNALLVDYLPSHFSVTCLSCATMHVSLFKKMVPGIPQTQPCLQCHERLTLKFLSVQWYGHALECTPQRRQETHPHRSSGGLGKPLIQPGQPLPKFGTCSHYTQSYRWFRFGCCSQLYPCDECHDQQTTGLCQGNTEFGQTMVCGYCSKEQRVQSTCKFCQSSLISSKSSSQLHGKFWEGGKGTRNPTLMNVKDSKKYKNLNKTQSKKSERVGVKGKLKVNQEKEKKKKKEEQ